MPTITVEGPPAGVEAKRGLVRKLTAAASEAYGLPQEVMVVLIRENAPENVGVGGELLVDRKKADG